MVEGIRVCRGRRILAENREERKKGKKQKWIHAEDSAKEFRGQTPN
jgi:hypothetical protein